MLFAHRWLLLLLPLALVVLVLMLLSEAARRRAMRRFGDPLLVEGLVTFDAGPRRALKGGLRILAVVLAIIALARPRYGRGTKVVPIAEISAVVVLDVSKSMYAQDVLPSRIERARSDATRMIKSLPQIRWGAVAFAGEAVAFPPTTDAAEAAQFLRAHEPHAMPGGTAIAKALELARRQLVASPKEPSESDNEGRPSDVRRASMIVLITDGEDLEGDPVAVARQAHDMGITIHVVAVGSRAPQPIPMVDPDSGVAQGFARDEKGDLVTTQLGPEAEAQLRAIATETRGHYVQAVDGSTGIASIEEDIRAHVTRAGTKKVETLYAEIYNLPLAGAALLLLLDALVPEASRRRRKRTSNTAASAAGSLSVLFVPWLFFGGASSTLGCNDTVGRLFDRPDPQVEEARRALAVSADGGDADLTAARLALEDLVGFRCDSEAGVDRVVGRPGASFDLGLLVFRLNELLGQRFGAEEADAGEQSELIASERARELDCLRLLLGKVASDPAVPRILALKSQYLLGNFAFLARRYKEAVAAYEQLLITYPARGQDPAGDAEPPRDLAAVARDAAWNRAIALRRIEDESHDAGPDASDSSQDGASDGRSDGSGGDGQNSDDLGHEGGQSGNDDAASDGQPSAPDAEADTGRSNPPDRPDTGDDQHRPDAAPPQPSTSPSTSSMPPPRVDLRELDRFDQKAPLDLDMPAKMRERRRIPRSLDK